MAIQFGALKLVTASTPKVTQPVKSEFPSVVLPQAERKATEQSFRAFSDTLQQKNKNRPGYRAILLPTSLSTELRFKLDKPDRLTFHRLLIDGPDVARFLKTLGEQLFFKQVQFTNGPRAFVTQTVRNLDSPRSGTFNPEDALDVVIDQFTDEVVSKINQGKSKQVIDLDR